MRQHCFIRLGIMVLVMFVDVVSPAAVRATMSQVPNRDGGTSWHIECADCPRRFNSMTDRHLRLDSEGHPHLAYGEDHLYHVWHDGAQWHYETVDSTPEVGAHAALALDGADCPHISYYDNYNGDLRYAYRDDTGWHVETLDSEGHVGRYTSLALDDAGYPHISYYDYDNSDLKYAYRDTVGWHTEIVDIGGGVNASLALDAEDHPHISSGSQSLKYAYRDAMGWHVETVDSGESGGLFFDTSLVLDDVGVSHISYSDSINGDLKYAYRDAEGWNIEIVESAGKIHGYTSLALDGMGSPHISCHNVETGLKYAYRDAEGWRIETVDGRYGAGLYNSLVLDETGSPYISYHDGYTHYNLKYAYRGAGGWHTEIVDSEQKYTGLYTSLTLDETDSPHISYSGYLPNDIVKYAYRRAEGWHTETVVSGNYAGFTSLALDGGGYPHISYFDSDGQVPNDGNLRYAYQDARGWHIETVDGGWINWDNTSLALDDTGYPHISYFDYNDFDLMYAYRKAVGGWYVETVDHEEWYVGRSASLALDATGYPHISYQDSGNADLKYAYQDAERWHVETVDSEGNLGEFTSLALDATGYPHISYFDYSKADLKYAYQNAEGWHVETVDSEGNVGQFTSLALDTTGYPHISYQDYGNADLRYAYQDAEGWHVDTVDSEGNLGRFTSLALGVADCPHISYFDDSNGDLKYAYLNLSLHTQVTQGAFLNHPDMLTYTLTFVGHHVTLLNALPGIVRYVTASLTSTLPSSAVYSPTLHAIVWEGVIPTRVAQTVHFQVVPLITVTRSLSAPLTITNTAWLTDTQDGTSISATAGIALVPPPLLLTKYASPEYVIHDSSLLTYTLILTAPDLHVQLWDPLPSTVRYISNSLTSTLASSVVYSPITHAMLWAGRLPTDTGQTVQFQVVPIPGPALLRHPVVNTAWLTSTESGRVITTTATVNVTPPPLSLTKRASPERDVLGSDVVTYMLTLTGPGLPVQLWDPLPSFVRYVPGSLTSTFMPTTAYSPTAHAVFWEGILPTGTAATTQFQVKPSVTGTLTLQLAPPIVNTAWLTDMVYGRHVSATTIVNGQRLYLPVVLQGG